jgi:dienelactone hydrolase
VIVLYSGTGSPASGQSAPASAPGITQPADVFDLQAIRDAPLDATILRSSETNGIVTEEVEFTSDHAPDGTPIRTFGVLCYPRGGTNLPAVMWGQSGMSPANDSFPRRFALKGYISLSITLDRQTWKSGAPFDTADPRNANLTRLAVAHMRGITYLVSRPETDASRIGVGGSSYGGLYANMVAAVDPRVKVGMSFFAGGHHELGSNLPQFLALSTLAEIDIFRKTANADAGLSRRAVPFIWGAPVNDHWFHLPAVVQTYRDAIGEKRIAIVPDRDHGFPPNIDQQLLDWFDIYLTRTRSPYNKPGALVVEKQDNRLIAHWTWTGANPAGRAELVVGYGKLLPWHGWVQRYYLTVPATLGKESARAEIPVPEPGLEVYAFGNLYDEHDVLVSTEPVSVLPSEKGITAATAKPVINTFPHGGFEADDLSALKSLGISFGVGDPGQAQSGTQSVRFEKQARLKLLFVPDHAHRLSLWLKAEKPITLTVQVTPGVVAQAPAIKAIASALPGADASGEKPLPFTLNAQAGPDWKEIVLDCPFSGKPVNGYELTITPPRQAKGESPSRYWVDTLRFEPQWR